MSANETLATGVEQGIITADQAARLRALENAGQPPELPASPDDEQLRFVSGFGDIFVTIGLVMFLGATGYLTLLSGGPFALWPAVALAAWLLAEFFTRLRRMALPSIVLLIVFAWAVFAGIALTLWTSTEPPTNYRPSPGLFGLSMFSPAVPAISACVTVLLAALHYWRFRVPITIAAGCGALVVAIVSLANGLAPGLSRGAQDAVILVCGLATFGLAMRFDMTDPARLTRRTDIAFWLHLLAAPLTVHSLVDGLFDNTSSKLDPGSAVIIVALFLALGIVAILIDRRALLVSGLAYAGVAFSTLIRQAGVTDITTPLTVLALGAFVLLLSAGWKPLRAGVLRLAPSTLTRRLPQPTLSA